MVSKKRSEPVPILDSAKIMEQDYSYLSASGIEFDPYTLIFDQGPFAIKIAQSAREKYANQYRNFNVGDGLIAHNPRRKRTALFPGACWKPSPKHDKYCAEMQSSDNARRRGFTETIGAFVVATSDRQKIREVTGFSTPTLYPCPPCATEFLDASTVVVSVGETNEYEVQTGAHLIELYARPKSYEPTTLLIHDPDFALFAVAKSLYAERTAHLETYVPENRMERAEAVVYAFRDSV